MEIRHDNRSIHFKKQVSLDDFSQAMRHFGEMYALLSSGKTAMYTDFTNWLITQDFVEVSPSAAEINQMVQDALNKAEAAKPKTSPLPEQESAKPNGLISDLPKKTSPGNGFEIFVPPEPPVSKAKTGKRTCEICGKDISDLHQLAKTCSKECKDEKALRYRQAYRANGMKPLTEKFQAPAVDEKVDWCKHCEAYTTHDTMNHFSLAETPEPKPPKSEFAPGHEKSQAEVESWRPNPKLPGTPGYATAPRDDTEERRKPSTERAPF